MTVSLGTVASQYAKSSLAPCLMMPPNSCAVPGRKPGTSTKVTSGTLKQSQKRTKRAAFTEAAMSRQPARCAGWLATMPTGRPPSRPKPTTMFGANVACTSKKYRSSSTARTISFMSYGLFGCPGTMDCSDSSRRSAGSCVGRSGGSSVLFCGRNVSSSRMRARHSSSLSDAKWATHDRVPSGGAGLQREVHDLADLPRVGLGERAAEDGEVLREDEHRAPVDAARAGDDPVARDALLGHAEVVGLVDDEAVELEEGAGIEQELEPLAGGLLAGLVLAPDALLAPAELGGAVAAPQLLETLVRRHGYDYNLSLHATLGAGGVGRVRGGAHGGGRPRHPGAPADGPARGDGADHRRAGAAAADRPGARAVGGRANAQPRGEGGDRARGRDDGTRERRGRRRGPGRDRAGRAHARRPAHRRGGRTQEGTRRLRVPVFEEPRRSPWPMTGTTRRDIWAGSSWVGSSAPPRRCCWPPRPAARSATSCWSTAASSRSAPRSWRTTRRAARATGSTRAARCSRSRRSGS